jgi:hypothetical protein
MDDVRLRRRVKEIAEGVKNIRDDELFALLDNHIQPFCQAKGLRYDHRNRGGSHHAFTVGTSTFTVAKPHGTSLLKPVYVRSFLDAMTEIELYEQE